MIIYVQDDTWSKAIKPNNNIGISLVNEQPQKSSLFPFITTTTVKGILKDHTHDNDDKIVGIIHRDLVSTYHNTVGAVKASSIVTCLDQSTSPIDKAAMKIVSLFRIVKAKQRRYELQSKYPSLYMVSVDKVMNVDALKNSPSDIFAYVSGLTLLDDGKLKVISLSKTPVITSDSGHHVALVTSDIPLSFICVTIVKAKSTFARSEEPLGIVSDKIYLYNVIIIMFATTIIIISTFIKIFIIITIYIIILRHHYCDHQSFRYHAILFNNVCHTVLYYINM